MHDTKAPWGSVDCALRSPVSPYDGPPRVCAFCHASIASMFGDKAEDTTEELFA